MYAPIQLPLTEKHLEKGTPGSFTACAVVLALEAHFRSQPMLLATVNSTAAILVWPNGGRLSLQLDASLRHFIQQFDCAQLRKHLQPCTLSLDLTTCTLSIHESEQSPCTPSIRQATA